MKNNFDKNLQELLNSHTEQPSADCWNQISSQLDGLQMPDSNVDTSSASSSGGSASQFSQFMGSIAGKAVSAVLAAAAIGGIIALVVVNSPENDAQTQNETLIALDETQDKFPILNEDETLDNKEVTPTFKENENKTIEIICFHSYVEQKDTNNLTENKNVQPVNTVQNVASTPTVQQETEPVAKTETSSKSENKRRRPFFNNNNEAIENEEVAKNEMPQEIKELPKFLIPNILNPNGYYFVIEGIEHFSKTYLYICDRYGKVVYEKSNYKNDWGAENLPDGVYFYKFDFTYQGTQFTRTGSVTVKR